VTIRSHGSGNGSSEKRAGKSATCATFARFFEPDFANPVARAVSQAHRKERGCARNVAEKFPIRGVVELAVERRAPVGLDRNMTAPGNLLDSVPIVSLGAQTGS
jgi:hypothetical protein